MSEATTGKPADGGLKPGDVVFHKSLAWEDEPALWVVAREMEDGSLECRSQTGHGEMAAENFAACELQKFDVKLLRGCDGVSDQVTRRMEPLAAKMDAAGHQDLAYKLRLAAAGVAEVLLEIERAAATAE